VDRLALCQSEGNRMRSEDMATINSPDSKGTSNQNASELFDPFPEPKTWPTKWDATALQLLVNLRPARSKDGKRPRS
jgi:hypothetical protein